ncbi:MAG: hypothetical protein J0M16_00070 [Gammaproteobacteria bacterium]|nr:hypothetical protein [Gammaproteobacteria bacterium]
MQAFQLGLAHQANPRTGQPGSSGRFPGGAVIGVQPNRLAAARYGLDLADLQEPLATAIGGEPVGQTVEGRARFPISVRSADPGAGRDGVEEGKA